MAAAWVVWAVWAVWICSARRPARGCAVSRAQERKTAAGELAAAFFICGDPRGALCSFRREVFLVGQCGGGMVCSFGSPEGVKACVDVVFPWASMLLGLLGLVVVLFNLGSTGIVAYFLRTAKRHEKEKDDADRRANDAEQRFQELAGIVSGPLTKYQELVVETQDSGRRADQLEKDYNEVRSRFEAYKSSAVDNSEALKALKAAEDRIRSLDGKLASVRDAYNIEVDAFWSRPIRSGMGPLAELIKDSIPIILLGNQKGGVGKTTLAANLAAYFQHKAGERVLAVDLDYQGSMTMMMERQAGSEQDTFRSTVDLVFQRALPENWRKLSIVPLNNKLYYMPCYYSFEKVERSLEYSWLLGDDDDDMRFRLARVLLSPEIQRDFDRIIIDAPPRFTAGFVNGFCVATHLFVPTIVDDVALNAVGNFVTQFAHLSKVVNPGLQLAGIIGMRTTNVQDNALPQTMQARADSADVAARRALGTDKSYFIRDAVIRNYPSLASATGQGIPYFREETTRPMFDNLGRRIGEIAPRKRR